MSRSSLTFGIAFIALGIVLLFDRAGAVDGWQVVADWWPTIVVLAGLSQVLTRPRNVVGGVILAAIGGVLLLWTLGLADVIRVLWPVVLIGLGLWLLTRQARPKAVGRGTNAEVVAPGDELVVVFSDRDVRVPAGPYGGQAITAVFGDLDLDLLDARIDGRVTMPVTAIFGDVDLEVPAGWRVTVSGPELLGDVALSMPYEPPADAPELHLNVTCILGDVDVRGRVPAAPTTPAAPATEGQMS